jgi:predicted alpha/beta-hydrolase family hydrolase
MQTQEIAIPADEAVLKGVLTIPSDAYAIVLFAHGSGRGRSSAHNQYIADALHQAGLATLQWHCDTDLDSAIEQEQQFDGRSAEGEFGIESLARRLELALDWLYRCPDTEALTIGLFGVGASAAAALIAASVLPDDVGAVVSLGGRPDLARGVLQHVEAPTLFIVGEMDEEAIRLNQLGASEVQCEHRIMIVADAGQRFEEPGTLDHAMRLTCDWFVSKLLPIVG